MSLPRATEYQIHCAIVELLELRLPEGCLVHHSPNEGNHRVQYRTKQKKMGMRPGWPDLEIFVPRYYWKQADIWAPIFLEVKRPKGRVTNAQARVHKYLKSIGCHVFVVHGVDEVSEIIDKGWWQWSCPLRV